jgi:predicted esterase
MGVENGSMSLESIRGKLLEYGRRTRAGHVLIRRALIQLAVATLVITTLGAASEVLLSGSTQLADYSVYVPSGLQPDKKYPLVVLLSPSGDPNQLIERWKSIAERFKWILLASKKFHNGASPLGVFKDITTLVREDRLKLPIDRKRIIASGYSGGAMGSHMFVYEQPDFISGVIANTGMIDKDYATYPNYPRGKFVVFLSSPTDFRYRDMQGDRRFLEGLGWKTKWIEFKGGHVLAPSSAYDEAAEWVSKQF